MIGVISKKDQREIVQEFFELFKTPWEFYQRGKTYNVILSTCDIAFDISSDLVILYGTEKNFFDCKKNLEPKIANNITHLQYRDFVFPIYGRLVSFQESDIKLIQTSETEDIIGALFQTENSKVIRIGFDLFHEVEYLLCQGQPLQHAQVPTLDMHIAMLRDWIVGAGIPLVEVPSCPAGFVSIGCLTHDIDFLRIRDHKFDHTMFGFLYRALFRSLLNFLRGNIPLKKLLKNWRAVCLLPGVYLGIVKDYFFQFDQYLAMEKDLASTFFILPFKNRPGIDNAGQIHSARAARYDVNDIASELKQLMSAGCEIALHGIDAWRDTSQGREELQRIAQVTGQSRIGIRSHWLYQCPQSAQLLETAGFVYDSSVAYNETVGYRSGTTQVFRPLKVTKLLELPLHIMDTALFSTGRMDLTEPQAMALVEGIIANSRRFGGVLTINWHDRSLGPERLWDTFYEHVLARLKSMKVWFATASQVVSWFNARRSVSFHEVHVCNNELKVRLSSSPYDSPKLLLRVHMPPGSDSRVHNFHAWQGRIVEVAFSGDLAISISL